MTDSIYLSQVMITGLDVERPDSIMEMMRGNSYRQHQWLWKLFKSEEQRKFLYRESTEKQQISEGNYKRIKLPSFYVLSSVLPDSVMANVEIKTKPFTPVLRTGQNLFFQLRANPLVRKKREGYKNSQKCDVLMDAKYQLTDKTNCWPAMEDAAKNWLIKQGEKHGFKVQESSLIVQEYEQQEFTKRGSSSKIQFSSVDYQGLLEVSETKDFMAVLRTGLGSAKAFGCGLMLIRPV